MIAILPIEQTLTKFKMKKLLVLLTLTMTCIVANAQELKKGYWKYEGDKNDKEVVLKAFDYQSDNSSMYVFEYDGLFLKKYGAGKIYIENGWIKFRVVSGYGINKKKDYITHQFKYELIDNNTLVLILSDGKKLKYTRDCE